jgi:uncharacterized protein YggE
MNENKSLQEILASTGVRVALMSVLSILAFFLLVQTIGSLQGLGRAGTPATDTITVNGDGQTTLPPDIAHISFTVQNTDTAVADAQSATTKQGNSAIAFLKEQGIADKDVKTLSYNISPQYSYPTPCSSGYCPTYTNSAKVTGYQVSQSIQVTVRDLSKVGALVNGLGKLSVQNVSGPDFTLDDTTAGYDLARAEAIIKAKKQAGLLAKQLGVSLGKIVNFSESSGGRPYPVYAMGGAMDLKSESVPNIPVGENTYSASVSITYEIR